MRKTYLPLSDEDRDYLKALSKKRTIQAQVVDRARILLYKADGMTFQQIADKLAISTATVRLCISKFQKGGLDAALFDVQRPGRPSDIPLLLHVSECICGERSTSTIPVHNRVLSVSDTQYESSMLLHHQ